LPIFASLLLPALLRDSMLSAAPLNVDRHRVVCYGMRTAYHEHRITEIITQAGFSAA
jgi:hypothetical protein